VTYAKNFPKFPVLFDEVLAPRFGKPPRCHSARPQFINNQVTLYAKRLRFRIFFCQNDATKKLKNNERNPLTNSGINVVFYRRVASSVYSRSQKFETTTAAS